MSHTICCDEFEHIQSVHIAAGEVFIKGFKGYENIPCIVETRFDGTAPGAGGNVQVAKQVWTRQKAVSGDLNEVRTSAEIVNDYNLLGSSGFTTQFPQGIGCGLIIVNNTNQALENMYISLRYLYETVESLAAVKGVKR